MSVTSAGRWPVPRSALVSTPAAYHCPTCGRVPPPWPTPDIIEAFRAFAGRHGRAPSATEWERTSKFHPSRSTVMSRFGSWTAGVRAAGLVPVGPGSRPDGQKWSRDEQLKSMRRWYVQHGRSPRVRDFDHAEGYPSHMTVIREFGSWNRALVLAGLPVTMLVKASA